MNNQSAVRDPQSKILVIGAGPAGSSLAIRMAVRGYHVTLIERETFPRHKLCGEFISPECFRHFDELGVRSALFTKGGSRITETRFYSPGGMNVAVPTSWFGSSEYALSLSRAEMDHQLLLRARELGVEIHEGCRVVEVEKSSDRIETVTARNDAGEKFALSADIFVDATGRSAALSKLAAKQNSKTAGTKIKKAGFVGFKTHLTGAVIEPNACEIYFFSGGYGGLSQIEDGMANFCCLIKTTSAKDFFGKTNELFDSVRKQNRRAAETLRNAEPLRDWIGVPVDGFGEKPGLSVVNLFKVGDAGAFIDPFTGSGILMALESSELLGICIEHFSNDLSAISASYIESRHELFKKRLIVSRCLRKAAFVPHAASTAIFFARQNGRLRGILARATRGGKSNAEINT